MKEPLERATLGRTELFVPSIVLDKTSSVSLHQQIYHQIARAIRKDAIHYEARLPSTRVMAKLLRVSRNTVLAAYEDLAADDLVRGERGAGMRINRCTSVPKVTSFGLQQCDSGGELSSKNSGVGG